MSAVATTSSEKLERIIDDVASQGWSCCDEFVDAELVSLMRQVAVRLHGKGEFKPAAVGAGQGRALRPDVRNDDIYWLDRAPPPVTRALVYFEELRLALNRDLGLGLFSHEIHYAHYAPGAHYARHIDRLEGDPSRIVSTVLYLNKDWAERDGGQLRLHFNGESPPRSIDILPESGRLVIFLSDEFYHEVLPAERERFSLTGWFRRRSAVHAAPR